MSKMSGLGKFGLVLGGYVASSRLVLYMCTDC